MKIHPKGFTLIELMIVITIIGILAAVAVPQYSQYKDRGKFIEEVGGLMTQYKVAAENDVRNGVATSLADLTTEKGSIPKEHVGKNGSSVANIAMDKGEIIATGNRASRSACIQQAKFGTEKNSLTWESSGHC